MIVSLKKLKKAKPKRPHMLSRPLFWISLNVIFSVVNLHNAWNDIVNRDPPGLIFMAMFCGCISAIAALMQIRRMIFVHHLEHDERKMLESLRRIHAEAMELNKLSKEASKNDGQDD